MLQTSVFSRFLFQSKHLEVLKGYVKLDLYLIVLMGPVKIYAQKDLQTPAE